MVEIVYIDKLRREMFRVLLDLWFSLNDKKDDVDPAEKTGIIAQKAEAIKEMVLYTGTAPRPETPAICIITESEKLSSWKTDASALKKIEKSIEKFGLKNYPVVRKTKGGYQLIGGALHYEACKILGMEQITVLVKDCSDIEAEEFTLLDAFNKIGSQNPDPHLLTAALRFYNTLLN
jgi:hypothetical protein